MRRTDPVNPTITAADPCAATLLVVKWQSNYTRQILRTLGGKREKWAAAPREAAAWQASQ